MLKVNNDLLYQLIDEFCDIQTKMLKLPFLELYYMAHEVKLFQKNCAEVFYFALPC